MADSTPQRNPGYHGLELAINALPIGEAFAQLAWLDALTNAAPSYAALCAPRRHLLLSRLRRAGGGR